MIDFDKLLAIPDPADRAEASVTAMVQAEADLERLRDIRDTAINELHHQRRVSLQHLADRYGLSKTRIGQIVS